MSETKQLLRIVADLPNNAGSVELRVDGEGWQAFSDTDRTFLITLLNSIATYVDKANTAIDE